MVAVGSASQVHHQTHLSQRGEWVVGRLPSGSGWYMFHTEVVCGEVIEYGVSRLH